MSKSPPERTLSATRVRALLDEYGIKDAQLARRLGCTNQVGRWLGEYGERAKAPSGDTLAAMCELLGVSPPFVFGAPMEECAAYLVRAVTREIGPMAGQVLAAIVGGKEAPTVPTLADAIPLEPWEKPPEAAPVSAGRPPAQRLQKRGARDGDAKKPR